MTDAAANGSAAGGHLLQLDDVHVYYGAIAAVKGLSLTVDQGEIVTLIGSNGAGKSTTLRTISGLLRPKRGSVTFLSRPIHTLAGHEIVALGISQSPEGRRIFGRMTVFENLQMGSVPSQGRWFDQDVEKVFTLFPRLKERMHQRGGTLSGGEQQMLAVARALARELKLLLLDEPYEGLAPVIVREIEKIVADIKSQGITTVIVEQNAVAALELADHAVIMDHGQIVFGGTAAEVLGNAELRTSYLAV